jgi:hypothetical protein
MEVTAGDILDHYDFEEDTLVYVDAPLAGWMRDKTTGVRYSFECMSIVDGLLWHWALVPDSGDGKSHFDHGKADGHNTWRSIVEERRDGLPYKFTSVELRFSKVKPPSSIATQARQAFLE